MYVKYVVNFKGNLPTLDSIVKDLCKKTGIQSLTLSESLEVINPFNDSDSVDFLEQEASDNSITIVSFHENINYLLGVSLYILKQKGGNVKIQLPDWVNTNWENYKQGGYYI